MSENHSWQGGDYSPRPIHEQQKNQTNTGDFMRMILKIGFIVKDQAEVCQEINSKKNIINIR